MGACCLDCRLSLELDDCEIGEDSCRQLGHARTNVSFSTVLDQALRFAETRAPSTATPLATRKPARTPSNSAVAAPFA